LDSIQYVTTAIKLEEDSDVLFKVDLLPFSGLSIIEDLVNYSVKPHNLELGKQTVPYLVMIAIVPSC